MKRLLAVGALLALCSCASIMGKKDDSTKVSEADMGRLSEGQMGPVNAARQVVATAQDEEDRAQLSLDKANQEVDLAKADQTSAKAEKDQADAQQKIAEDSREPAQVQKAQALTLEAEAHRQAADAHFEYASKLVDARKASVTQADRRIDLAHAKLEVAKLQAMQQANVPASGKYDLPKLQSKVDDAQKDYDDAARKAQDKNGEATASQQRWQELQQQQQRQAANSTHSAG